MSPSAHLLRLAAMYHRSQQYLPRQDFVCRSANVISDCSLRSADLTDAQRLAYLDTTFPQKLSWRQWTPPPAKLSVIVSALRQTTSPRDSLRGETPALTGTRPSGPTSANRWPSTPYFAAIKTLSPSSASSPGSTALGTLLQPAVMFGPRQCRIPYGWLCRRSLRWGPRTPA